MSFVAYGREAQANAILAHLLVAIKQHQSPLALLHNDVRIGERQFQRRVIALRFAEEKSIREIASELGRSEGAVKQLQFRALQNLRARMEGANA